jgi:hypothetical protein
VCIAGLTSLFTCYLMQRWVSNHARRRRRVSVTSVRPAGADHSAGTAKLSEEQVTQLLMRRPVPQPRAAVVRRLRVSHKIKRRIRFHPVRAQGGLPARLAGERAAAMASGPLPRASAPGELSEALRNLRQALQRLRRLLPPSNSGNHADSLAERRAR